MDEKFNNEDYGSKDNLEELLANFYHHKYEKGQYFESKQLIDAGYIKNGELTEEGKKIAINLLRRERLSERLLFDVLGVDMDEATSDSCILEHVISDRVADAICTLLGHPKVCLHGFEIPRGSCCVENRRYVDYVIMPLSDIQPGRRYVISYLMLKDPKVLSRLISCGIKPGEEIKLITKFPSYVVEVSGTQIAFESEIARVIFVREA